MPRNPSRQPSGKPPGAKAVPRPARAPAVQSLNGLSFNLADWIGARMAGDQGSVGNREVFPQSDFIFQVIKGPNRRNDFHIDPYDEIFYQLEGTAYVVWRDGQSQEQVATLRQGDVLLIAAFTPHSPQRPPGTVGLVVERPRTPQELDGVVWYCEGCGNTLDEVWLPCQDIVVQLKLVLDAFNADVARRTCRRCGSVLADPNQAPGWQRLMAPASGAETR